MSVLKEFFKVFTKGVDSNEEINEPVNSYCCIIAGGKKLTSGTSERIYFVGTGNARIDSICPSEKELRTMFPNSQNIQTPVYVGTTEVDGKTVPNVRIDVFTVNAMDGINCRFSIFLTKAGIKGSTSGKIQVIDSFGRTAWVTPEELAVHATTLKSNNGGTYDAQISSDYRPAYRGEIELTKLVKCMLGIDDVRQWNATAGKFDDVTDPEKLEACKCRFELDQLEQFFKGKFDLLKEYLTWPTINEVKFMYGVRTATNGNIYQDICAGEFMKSTDRNVYDFEQHLSGRSYKNVEYSIDPVHQYAVNPTPVVAEANVEQPAVTAADPLDPTSNLPFLYQV